MPSTQSIPHKIEHVATKTITTKNSSKPAVLADQATYSPGSDSHVFKFKYTTRGVTQRIDANQQAKLVFAVRSRNRLVSPVNAIRAGKNNDAYTGMITV